MRCFINVPDIADLAVDCMYGAFAACFQSQAEAELDKRLGGKSKSGPEPVEMK